MCIACWKTRLQIFTQNMSYLWLFQCKSDCRNEPQYYVTRPLLLLLTILTVAVFRGSHGSFVLRLYFVAAVRQEENQVDTILWNWSKDVEVPYWRIYLILGWWDLRRSARMTWRTHWLKSRYVSTPRNGTCRLTRAVWQPLFCSFSTSNEIKKFPVGLVKVKIFTRNPLSAD